MRREIVALSQVPEEERDINVHCFYCSCPKHHKKVKAVVAIKVIASPIAAPLYFGICGHHAEAYPLTEEERKRQPLLCRECFPQLQGRTINAQA